VELGAQRILTDQLADLLERLHLGQERLDPLAQRLALNELGD